MSTPRTPMGAWPAIQTSVPLYELQISAANLQALEDNVDDREFEVPGTFKVDGRTWNVVVRYRGRSTRYLPKKSFEVKFDDADKFTGNIKALQLAAEWKDGALLTEKMWFDLAAAAGVRAPKTKYVRLNLNGSFYGVFLDIESVKKAFLKEHSFFADSDIYRCGQFDCEMRDGPREAYQEDWTKQTNEDQPSTNLTDFMKKLNRSSPAEFRALLEESFETHEYLQWLAVDALISNDTIQDARSYLVWDPHTKRWTYVPWDLNNAVSLMNRLNGWPQWPNSSRPLKNFTVYDPRAYHIAEVRQNDPYLTGAKPAWSTLSTRMLDDAQYRSELKTRLQDLLDNEFTVAKVGQRAQQQYDLIKPYLAQDPFVDQTLASNAVQYMKDYVTARRNYIAQRIGELSSHGSPSRLLINKVGVDAAGAWFVELLNNGSATVQLSGKKLTGELRRPNQATLSAITLAPGATVTLKGLSGFSFNPNKVEIGLFENDGKTAIDTLFLPAMSSGETWGRVNGTAEWKKQ